MKDISYCVYIDESGDEGFVFHSDGSGSSRWLVLSAVDHSKLAGLQIADAVASSFFYAVNLNRYEEVEDKYARILLPNCYRHNGAALGYGLKFWPEEFRKLILANPHIAIFADEVKL